MFVIKLLRRTGKSTVIADKKTQNSNGDSSFLQVFCFIVLTVSWLILLKMKRLGREGIMKLIYPMPVNTLNHTLFPSLGEKSELLSK